MSNVAILNLLLADEAARRLRWYGAALAALLVAMGWAGVYYAAFPPKGVPSPGPMGLIIVVAIATALTYVFGTVLWGAWVYRHRAGSHRAASHRAAPPRQTASLPLHHPFAFRAWRIVTFLNIFGAIVLACGALALIGVWVQSAGLF